MLCCVSRTWTGRIGVTVLFESPAVNDGDTARRTARTVGIWTGYLKGKSQRACRACLTWRAECARAYGRHRKGRWCCCGGVCVSCMVFCEMQEERAQRIQPSGQPQRSSTVVAAAAWSISAWVRGARSAEHAEHAKHAKARSSGAGDGPPQQQHPCK